MSTFNSNVQKFAHLWRAAFNDNFTMKKQYFRIKQRMDQILFCSDKSEVFNTEELQIAYQKTQYFEKVLPDIVNALPQSRRNDHKIKSQPKNQLEQLAFVFLEQASNKQDDSQELFSTILRRCGKIESDLALEFADHEDKLWEFISEPIQTILDSKFKAIAKQKRIITKLLLDEDSARARFNVIKKESIWDLSDTCRKVEQSRDILACEMFNLLALENEFAVCVLQIVKLQRAHHEIALKYLSDVIPILEDYINNWKFKK